MPDVLIVPTGAGNLASVRAALRRLGVEPRVASDARELDDADRVVLPGVGAFGPAMLALEARGFADGLRRRIDADRPTLAICLGMQLLATRSDEAPGVAGLGIADAEVTRFVAAPGLRSPHLGWAAVEGPALARPGFAAFAHSHRFVRPPTGWLAAWSTHGERFVAALRRGALVATQFHPELSGAWGAALLAESLDLPFTSSSEPPCLSCA
jgi:imidazole glycerol phosphate synthase glutamine amidotransferase subunit